MVSRSVPCAAGPASVPPRSPPSPLVLSRPTIISMALRGGGGGASGDGAVREAMRQAMLRHEDIFRSQVRELHRLYWTQKTLMRELCREASAAAAQTMGFVRPEERKQTQKQQPVVSFDLRLPADEYIRGGGGGPVSDLVVGSEMARGLKYSTSPSIDLSTQKRTSTDRKILHIDLNIEQNDESLNHLSDSTITYPSPATSSSVQHGFLSRKSSNISSKVFITCQPAYVNPSSSTSGGGNANWSLQSCQNLQPCNTKAFASQSSKVTENSWKLEHEMINKVHEPDYKIPEKRYKITPEEFCSGSVGGVQTSIIRIEPSPMDLSQHREENADSLPGQRNSFVHSDCRRQDSIVTFSCSFDYNNQYASVGSTNPLTTITVDSYEKRTNCNGSEEDTVSSHAIPQVKDQHGGLLEEFPVVRKSTQTNEDTNCNVMDKDTERHGIPPVSEDSGTTQLNSSESCLSKKIQSTETCDHVNFQDKLCCNGERKHQVHLDQHQTQVADMDVMTTKAAEMLVSLSLDKPEYPNGLESIKETVFEDDQPQYSCDSFESITLKLSEIRDDGFWMPARSTERAVEKDECGVKLRPGRRLPDFQRDVLPGLASLSRHEIREDLQTIGHEFRRNKPRQDRDNWFVPVRSRRSRRYSVGQRH